MQYIHPAATSRIPRYLLATSIFQIISGLGASITGSVAFILRQEDSNVGLVSAGGIWSGFFAAARVILSCMAVATSATAFALHLYGTRTKISVYLSAFLAVGFVCSMTKTSIEVNRTTVAPAVNYPYLQVPVFVEPVPRYSNNTIPLQNLRSHHNENPIIVSYPQSHQFPMSQTYSNNPSAFVTYKPANKVEA
ncbi:uncharacterized protein TRIADDRAFT_58213 [Trichoplax adhaerens]|uniref:Uncharacterized protein n=1 Tax=Trichoplax adhaerens TaxID=10228 RepID=B3S165_TRIAD|nr:hypothetical protein TRIADDRAFT_58213 [Trichoplax adhaerens]EDV23184.1 hypothetical protein TRIADDRAFT_58213 [Trichoplax adhaerens]|eukprot:XP_002114094.1 hypothetical protein TRIADDRAFT_58213 [Trichoplax adhaerens]